MNDEPTRPEPDSRDRQVGDAPQTAAPAAPTPWVDRLFGWLKPAANGSGLRTDLEDALAEEQHEGSDFSPEERAMLRNILRLRETRTEDVMVPRADIVAVDQSTSLAMVLAQLRTSGHSRMPVFDGSLDHPVGMVHIKDVVSLLIDRARNDPAKTRRRGRPARSAAAEADAVQAGDPRAMTFDLGRIDLVASLRVAGIIRAFGPKVRPFIEKHLEWCFILGTLLLIGGFVALKLLR